MSGLKNHSDAATFLTALWAVVRSIPRGCVLTYGQVGRLLPNPATGYQVGRWMAQAPPNVPWWRVVAKNGALPISKRAHNLAAEQRIRLEAEGVPFLPNGKVDMARSAWLYEPKGTR